MALRGIVRVRHRAVACAILRRPLVRSCRALGQFPFVAEQVLEEIVAPLGWRFRPDHFQAAGDSVGSFAAAEFALPSQALFFNGSCFRFRAHECGVACAVCFTKSMASGNQRDGLFVVHGHATERFANVPGRRDRIRPHARRRTRRS